MNDKKEPKKLSERFDKHYLLLSLLFLVLLAASIALMVIFIHHEIFSVFFAFTSVGLLIAFFLTIKKAILEGTFEEIMYSLFVALGKAITFILMPVVKLLTKLGLLGGRLNNANDEHSFIFDFGGRGGRTKVDKMPKWKNLTAERPLRC